MNRERLLSLIKIRNYSNAVGVYGKLIYCYFHRVAYRFVVFLYWLVWVHWVTVCFLTKCLSSVEGSCCRRSCLQGMTLALGSSRRCGSFGALAKLLQLTRGQLRFKIMSTAGNWSELFWIRTTDEVIWQAICVSIGRLSVMLWQFCLLGCVWSFSVIERDNSLHAADVEMFVRSTASWTKVIGQAVSLLSSILSREAPSGKVVLV